MSDWDGVGTGRSRGMKRWNGVKNVLKAASAFRFEEVVKMPDADSVVHDIESSEVLSKRSKNFSNPLSKVALPFPIIANFKGVSFHLE